MTPTQLAALAAEVTDDPVGMGYAAWLPDQPGHVVRLMTEPTRQKVASRMMSERGVLDTFPLGIVAADALLTRLEAIAASAQPLASIVARALRFLRMPEGIDLGSPGVQVMLGTLRQAGAISESEQAALRSLAMQPCSRAAELGLPPVTEAHLRAAGVL